MSLFNRLFGKNETRSSTITEINFMNTFPHVFWLSEWIKDNRGSYRYKVITIRHEPSLTIELFMLLETEKGIKQQQAHLRGTSQQFQIMEEGVARFEKDLGVDLVRFDLSAIGTIEAFKTAVEANGWEMTTI